MTSLRLAPSISALGCVTNTCAPQLGPFIFFTPKLPPSAPNSSYSADGTAYYNLQMRGQPAQPLPQAFSYACGAPTLVPSLVP